MVSAGYVEAVVEALGPLGAVTAKRMFGGAGIWADGVMFALIADDALYLKADETTRARFEAERLAPFRYAKANGQVAVMSYWRAPERLIDEPDELAVWAREALAVAQAAAVAKTRKPPRRVSAGRAPVHSNTGRKPAARRKR